MFTRKLLSVSILAALVPCGVRAQAAPADADGTPQLDEVTVTADPLAQPGDELFQPVEVLAGSELDEARQSTVGATVEKLPGVQSSYFGPGVGRPIIRGLDGARVQVLGDGLSSLDVSTVSVDHAVSVDPYLADQIEILKGPATLLYGSGAIGGVVNVVDGRIPKQPVEGFSGRAELRATGVDDGQGGVARVDAGNGRFALHADYARRSGEDYDAPGRGSIENTQSDTTSRAFGAAITGERGHVGMAVSAYDNAYGIPPEAEEEDTDLALVGRGSGKGGEGEGPVELRMDQQRVDFDAMLRDPLPGLESLGARIGRNDYEHEEVLLESGEVGTRFLNDAVEGRIEAVHAPLGAWRGAIGLQSSRREFEAIGDEAFVPASETSDLGVFLVERATFGAFGVELGARLDRQDIDVDVGPTLEHDATSLSVATKWDFAEGWHLAANLDRAERAPSAEELLSDGPHEATGSFEIGDPTLDVEASSQIEVGIHFHGDRVRAELAAYDNRFDDFIFLADTDLEEDGLPVRLWTQADARFRGFEAEVEATVADTAWGRLDASAFGDRVSGSLRDGGNLPRIAPARFGISLDWTYDAVRASASATRYADQDRTAALESATPGYTLVDAQVSWAFDLGDADGELFLAGRNLTDREARVHTSLLKDRAPLPGRGFVLGFRSRF
jgi:iron complex outermembrane receptor protein